MVLLAVVVAGACSSLGIPAPGGGTGSDGGTGSGGAAGSGGGSAPGDGGVVTPPVGPGVPGTGEVLPPGAQPSFMIPRPGQQGTHAVAIATLAASVEGRTAKVTATWWSGVEPCNVLDSVQVTQDGDTFTVSLLEGTSDPNAVCDMIAMLKATAFSIGPLEPGTYTIRAASGDATPISITVS